MATPPARGGSTEDGAGKDRRAQARPPRRREARSEDKTDPGSWKGDRDILDKEVHRVGARGSLRTGDKGREIEARRDPGARATAPPTEEGGSRNGPGGRGLDGRLGRGDHREMESDGVPTPASRAALVPFRGTEVAVA